MGHYTLNTTEKPRLAIKQHLLTLACATPWPPLDWDVEARGPQPAKLVVGTSPDEGWLWNLPASKGARSCIKHNVGAPWFRKKNKIKWGRNRWNVTSARGKWEDNDKPNATQSRIVAWKNASHCLCIKSRQADDIQLTETCQQWNKVRANKRDKPLRQPGTKN